jgi:2-haloacid dehalogenase
MTIRALAFDTFGTLVDWRGSILAELDGLGARRGLVVDWPRFLADWKSCYREGMDKVNAGAWPWTTVEAIYHRRLVELLATYQCLLCRNGAPWQICRASLELRNHRGKRSVL